MDVILSNNPQTIETMHGSDQEEENPINLPERVGPVWKHIRDVAVLHMPVDGKETPTVLSGHIHQSPTACQIGIYNTKGRHQKH